MKPFKIIPHPSVLTVLSAALLTQAHACTLRSSFGMSHNFTARAIFLNDMISKKKKKPVYILYKPETIFIVKML